MSVLLDSDVCIAILRPRPSLAKARLGQALKDGVALSTSVVVVVELMTGALKSEDAETALGVLEVFLDRLQTLPFEPEDARAAAHLRAMLERQGKKVGPYDLLIGAQALARGLTLVTGNDREFSRIAGLEIVSWLE